MHWLIEQTSVTEHNIKVLQMHNFKTWFTNSLCNMHLDENVYELQDSFV